MRLQYDIQVYSFFLEVLMNKDMPVISRDRFCMLIHNKAYSI